jgi:hypothetical protein
VLALDVLARRVGIRVLVRRVLFDVLVRAMWWGYEADRCYGDSGGCRRGAAGIVCRCVTRVGATQALRWGRRVCGDRGVGDPVPAAGVVFVVLGFERHALLAVDFFADCHGIAEVLWHVYCLLAAWLGVVVVVEAALERAYSVDELGAWVGVGEGSAVRRAEAALNDAGHGDSLRWSRR